MIYFLWPFIVSLIIMPRLRMRREVYGSVFVCVCVCVCVRVCVCVKAATAAQGSMKSF